MEPNSPPPPVVIIADDLSGAADCAVACARAESTALVLLDGASPTDASADVLSIDADTRGRSEAEAATTVAALVRRHGDPARRLFKKLDSTLRGHVGVELAATLRARREAGPATLLVAPAFPAAGRITVDGWPLLGGRPLGEAEMWRGAPQPPGHLPALLERAGLRTDHMPLPVIRGPDLAAVVAASRADAIVFDAAAEDDLRRVAAAAVPLGTRAIWAGSAGLARHMPAPGGVQAPPVPPTCGPILFAVGSLSGLSREQAARLDDVERLVLPPAVLRADAGDARRAGFGERLRQAIGSGRDVVAVIGDEGTIALPDGPLLARALASLLAPCAARIGALVATGGETARAVLDAFGVGGLRLLGEVEPGVPLSVATGARPLRVVTKAGAFGDPDTLLRCRAALRVPLRPERFAMEVSL